MEISNPRRILAIGAPESGILTLLQDLTGSAPEPLDDSTAGLSHTWTLRTPYYTATIPIWLDEIASAAGWRAEFLKPDAAEVVNAVGGWLFCFRKPVGQQELDAVREALAAIKDVIGRGADAGWDGVCVAVAMAQSTAPCLERTVEEWEELCAELGFEFVDAEAKGTNEFREKVGLERVREAMEANDWVEDVEIDLDGLDLADDEEEDAFYGSFAAEEAEMNVELLGMKNAVKGVEDEDEEQQVEELERIMMKLQAVKETSSTMSERERRKFAAKAVNSILNDI